MPGIKLFTSNRLEILIQELADLLRTPLQHPLQKEIIVVQSKGMERWISLELARRHEICANIRFPFPGHYITEIFREAIPENASEDDPFDTDVMTWNVMRLLPSLLADGGFELIKRYLGGPDNDVRLFQLSSRIAETFDHYLLFRPDMIMGWEEGRENHWQAVLWRTLAGEKDRKHPAALRQEFFNLLHDHRTTPIPLPERISVFGISALPPFHIEVLAAISRLTQVNLFLMNPCAEYWGTITPDREMSRLVNRQKRYDLLPADLYLESGNSLLASLGTQGRDFFELINSYNFMEEMLLFFDPGEGSLLSAIQSDILNLRDRKKKSDTPIRFPDLSLQIHSCHSPMREMEALQDQLLALFENHPDLKPADILVMTPDIGLYAPYIQAVFSLPTEDNRFVPFSIADRGVRQESILVDHFLKLLDLPESRFGAAQVFAFLESVCVRDKFSLSEDDLELIRTWIEKTGIRWGIDADARASMDLPAGNQNTWRAGIDRMLLGYAFPPGTDEELFAGILPFSEIEGSDTAVFEKLLVFTECLFHAVGALTTPRTLAEWSEFLANLLETFFITDQDNTYDRDLHTIRQSIYKISELGVLSAFTETVNLDVIKAWLTGNLEKQSFGRGFLTGGITFCALLPMRSIPFKVVCLVGMDDGAYPRESPVLGFDLMARHHRPGDRSRRDDDRYLFLEALLSARKTLYISYTGQSAEDNSSRPPSVMVSELLDYMEEGFFIAEKDIREKIVTKHPLQAFSHAYFESGSHLFSYSDENCRAALHAVGDRQEPTAFISSGLPEPDEEWRSVELDDLCRFFANPARYLLTRRLGIHLTSESLLIDETEPFSLEGLERYDIRRQLTEKALDDKNIRDLYGNLAASGRLPHGSPGAFAHETLCRATVEFTDQLKPFISGGLREPLEVNLAIGSFHLTGRLNELYHSGPVIFRPTRVKASDYLRAWIRHLVFN
ncbi:MAG: exodeoxyribonuclease V subunit gamma, partial [Syntrophales bacterium]|nr:exodeoxyribonuclease V subunit gamma [Syntrophales bacterium]